MRSYPRRHSARACPSSEVMGARQKEVDDPVGVVFPGVHTEEPRVRSRRTPQATTLDVPHPCEAGDGHRLLGTASCDDASGGCQRRVEGAFAAEECQTMPMHGVGRAQPIRRHRRRSLARSAREDQGGLRCAGTTGSRGTPQASTAARVIQQGQLSAGWKAWREHSGRRARWRAGEARAQVGPSWQRVSTRAGMRAATRWDAGHARTGASCTHCVRFPPGTHVRAADRTQRTTGEC